MKYDIDSINNEVMYDGFFSEYLPPTFNLKRSSIDIFKSPPPSDCDLIEPAIYSMGRFNNTNEHRNIYLPEIGTYVVLMNFVNNENIIKDIIDFTRGNEFSFSPILGDDGAILRHEKVYNQISETDKESSSNYIDNIMIKINRSKGAIGVLNLDISNCYASFYTHMLPAILLGKKEAETDYKKMLKSKSDSTINPIYKRYEELDKLVRRINGNRTNGVLAGPIISKILIEGILSRIDKELCDMGINFSRYVDDFEVYIYDERDIEKIKITISSVLNRYYFSVNNEKTKYTAYPFYIVENLEKVVKTFIKTGLPDETLMELFNKFFIYETGGAKGAIGFLLKNLEQYGKPISSDLFNSYLLNILNNDSRALVKACSLIIKENKAKSISEEDINIIKKVLDANIKSKHDLEVTWLLFLLKNVNANALEDDLVDKIILSKNELAEILLISEHQLTKQQEQKICESAETWILLYELYGKKLISEEAFCSRVGVNKNKSFYRRLKNNEFSFYNNA